MDCLADRLLYIYTSGTEGLPKAAIIKHSRFIWMGAAVKYMVRIESQDVLYTSLPLYHLAGGTVGVCQSVIFGNTMAIRNKFSASNFWKDCVKYKCTVRSRNPNIILFAYQLLNRLIGGSVHWGNMPVSVDATRGAIR